MLKTLTLSLALTATAAFSQHAVPFESTANSIKLSVTNVSNVGASNVTIKVTNPPA